MTGDIMAVHVAIWNQGRKSIELTDILRPLIIETEKNVPILEASILKTSRDVIGLRLDESKCDQGKLEVSWTILEHRDGGIVQMIYEGSPELQITADAALKEQRAIIDGLKVLPYPYRSKNERWLFPLFLFAITSIGIYLWSQVWHFLLVVYILVLVLLILSLPFIRWKVRQAKPPFEF